ncbi:hypothetical protein ACS0PU_002645 [Formica fusca]
MPSRRNGATRSRSRSPLNNVDENVDQSQEDITSQREFNMSGTVVQENQLVNQFAAGQIQTQLTEKITKKTQYNEETEFEKQIVRDLTIIKFDMLAILEIVTTLSQTWIEKNGEINPKISKGEGKPEENILPTFPLENWQNFLDFENLLQTKDTARAQLEKILYNRGGKVPAELIRRMLVYVFTPHLSLQISWLGRKKNQRLEGTHFARILFDAVKNRYRKIDDRIIESTIIDWFRRASDRIPKSRDTAK